MITSRAVMVPIYDNSVLDTFEAWFPRNLWKLAVYMHQLQLSQQEATDEFLLTMARIQYERQVELDRNEYELQRSFELARMEA
jgi:hypothetical protein